LDINFFKESSPNIVVNAQMLLKVCYGKQKQYNPGIKWIAKSMRQLMQDVS